MTGTRGSFTPETASQAAKIRHAREKARKAGPEPYAKPFLTFLDAIGRGGPSRVVWRVFWKAADGLPLDADELAIYRIHTGRETAPTVPARECWIPAGRRGGKSENMIARATWRAISQNWRQVLTVGEVGTIPLIASDKDQARNSLAFLKGLARLDVVKPYVKAVKKDSVEFLTGAVVKIATASWRSTRGYTMLDAILEECAFYEVEGSANPDEEILTAIRPALLTVPGSRVYGISSPYAKRGILYKAYAEHWGQDGDGVLVFSAASTTLNPLLDRGEITRAFEADPIAAASEYGDPETRLVAFRSDVERFLSEEAVAAVVVPNRRELPPLGTVRYVAFTDPSGGSQDSWTLAIAHREGTQAILDAIRETRPPFSPDNVTADYATVLKSYHCAMVTGDRYGGEFPRELFRKAGIQYVVSERAKSDIYREVLAPINAGRVELLEHGRLKTQLVSLERRVARGGKDSIDHPPGGRDDLSNAVAGALVLTLVGHQVPNVTAVGVVNTQAPWSRLYGADDGDRMHRSIFDVPGRRWPG